MKGSSYNYSYDYKKKKLLKNCLYIIKMFCVLFIFIALPVWGVFKYREYDYQRKQAKVIQDFLERKGLYATSIEKNSLDVDTVSGIYIANNENNTNVNIESSSGIYIPNNNENIDAVENNADPTYNEYGTPEKPSILSISELTKALIKNIHLVANLEP